jgi:hypothetical protein
LLQISTPTQEESKAATAYVGEAFARLGSLLDRSCRPRKQGGKVFAASIWQKKGRKGLSPFHQETEAGSM